MPYALALEAEQQWGEQFLAASVLVLTSGEDYQTQSTLYSRLAVSLLDPSKYLLPRVIFPALCRAHQ